MPERATTLVIGGNGEIGSAIRDSLESAGFLVLSTHRNLPTQERRDELGRLLQFALDVTDRASVRKLFEEVDGEFGPVYGLVYVAGYMNDKPIAFLQDDDWQRVIDVNLTAAFTCLRAAARPMMVNGQGRVVLVGSVSSRMGIPGQAAYSASKAGLEALSRVAALEFGRYGITCNVVAPGAIDSGMFINVAEPAVLKIVQRTALRRVGTPNDVAAMVAFLLGADAAYVTGQTMVVDGGLLAS